MKVQNRGLSAPRRGIFDAESAKKIIRVITVRDFELPLGCQYQEDAIQRKRVAQVVVIGTRAHAGFRWRAYSTPSTLR